jgi:protein-tyrosine phosphatase
MKSILFVCLGNICRSPLAEGIASKLNEEHQLNLTINSAGTGSWHVGEAPCPNSIEIAKKHHIDISTLKGQQVSKEDFESYDLIIGLDDSNMNDLKKLGCKNLEKLGDYGFNGADVPDPFYFDGFEGFHKVFEMIETAVTHLLKSKTSLF